MRPPAPDVISAPIADVEVGDRLRPLGDVRALARSIKLVGLLHPIVVTLDMRLVSGLHRLEACRSLGWTHIPAHCIEASDVAAQIAEIDENLVRAELTRLQRADQLAKRKRLYEALHPNRRKQGHHRSRDPQNSTELKESYFNAEAARTGRSHQSLRNDVRIAESIAPDVKEAIGNTPVADSGVELMALAKLDPTQQRAVVAKLASGEAKRVREAAQQASAAIEAAIDEACESDCPCRCHRGA